MWDFQALRFGAWRGRPVVAIGDMAIPLMGANEAAYSKKPSRQPADSRDRSHPGALQALPPPTPELQLAQLRRTLALGFRLRDHFTDWPPSSLQETTDDWQVPAARERW